MNPQTKKMLTALLESENENCASLARRILGRNTTVARELKYTGSFMTAVLNGNLYEARNCADSMNLKALEAVKP